MLKTSYVKLFISSESKHKTNVRQKLATKTQLPRVASPMGTRATMCEVTFATLLEHNVPDQ